VSTCATLLIGFTLKVDRGMSGEQAGEYDDAIVDVILILLFSGVGVSGVYMTLKALPCFASGEEEEEGNVKEKEGDKKEKDVGNNTDSAWTEEKTVVEMHEEEVDQLHKEHNENDEQLKKKHAGQRRKSMQRIQERLLARTAIRYSKTLQNTIIFQHLSSDAISKIIDLMDIRSFDTGQTLVVQGDLGTEFMVIVKGAVNILQNQQVVNKLGGLDCLGEGAMVHDNHYRAATAVATTSTKVLILSYSRYQELLLNGTIAQTTHETLAKISESYSVGDKIL